MQEEFKEPRYGEYHLFFTNLTRDHLDYHHSFENYRDAKGRLFRDLSSRSIAVLNADGHVMHFHEKPEPPAPSNMANAGVWLFQPALLEELDRNTHCMVEQLATYALGRGTETSDHDYLEAIAEVFEATGHHFDDLAYLIATSPIFTHRRGEPEEAGGAP